MNDPLGLLEAPTAESNNGASFATPQQDPLGLMDDPKAQRGDPLGLMVDAEPANLTLAPESAQSLQGQPVAPGMPTSVKEVAPMGLNERGQQVLLSPETLYKGIPEAAASTVTGIAGFGIGKIYQGLNTLALTIEGHPDPVGAAKKTGEKIAEWMTYQPESASGKELAGFAGGVMNLPFEAVRKGLELTNLPPKIQEAAMEGFLIGTAGLMAAKMATPKLSRAETAARKAAGLDKEATTSGARQEQPIAEPQPPLEPWTEAMQGLEPSAKAVEMAKQPEPGVPAETITSGELKPGATFTRNGEQFKVERINDIGTVKLADGVKFDVPEGQTILADQGSFKLAPRNIEPIPELKPEEIPPSGLPKEPPVQAPAVKPQGEGLDLGLKGDALRAPELGGDIAAGGISYGMKLPKKAAGSGLNLERIDADYSVKFMINQIAEQNKQKIDAARRDIITLEETKKLADDLGLTEDQLLTRRKGQAFNAEQATAARDLLNTSARNVVEAQKLAVESGSDTALVKFRIALSRHTAIQAEVSGVAAEAGRALSAHRILSSEITAEAKGQKAMLDALGGRELTENILNEMKKIDPTNVAEVNRFIQAFSKVKFSDKIYEAWINFILSGPKTHIANVIGNTLTALTKPIERAISTGIEKGLAKIQKRPSERFINEVSKDALGMMAGVIDGARAALKTFKTEVPTDALMKIEQAKYKAIKGKKGEIIRLPGRFLMAADEFFKSINYTGEIYAQAYRKAKMEGARGKDLQDKTASYVNQPTLTMIEQAKFEAQVRTFTNPYGKYTQYLDRVRNIPGVRYIVPFLRTPTNIAKFALERTPMNFPRIAYKAYKGEFKGPQIADELAKPMLGSMIAAAVVSLAAQDLITGGGPKEKAKRDALFRTGWKPYSIKIGNQYVSYGRLEPIGSIAGMSADFVDLMKETNDEKTTSDYAQGIAMSISKNITSKTFMSGVSNMMDAISDPKRYGENWLEMTAGSVVPAVVGTTARAIDDTRREVHGPGEAIINRLPFLSQTLNPKRDVWGREIRDERTAVERGISPIERGTESTDVVDKELKKLGVTPSLPGKKLAGVTLSPIQYDIYLKQSGELAYEMVRDVVEGNYGDPEEKSKEIKNAIQKARDMVRKELIDDWNLTKER